MTAQLNEFLVSLIESSSFRILGGRFGRNRLYDGSV